MTAYFGDAIREQRARPRDGLVSALLTAEVDGDRLSDDEVVANCIITTVGGLILGILGFIGGPITMFKGLTQMGELLKDPSQYDAGQLAVIAGIKIVALLVAASALFRGGRIFPATFIGVALGLLVSALFPSLPMSLVVACAAIPDICVI